MDALTTPSTKPLCPSEAALALGVSTRTLRRYVREGLVPTYRLPSGHKRIHPRVIAELTEPVGPQNGHILARRSRHERPTRPAQAKLVAPGERTSESTRRTPLGTEAECLPAPPVIDTSPAALAALRESVCAES
jgi:hypothetical protein